MPASAAAARPSVTSCGTAPLEAFSRIHSSVSRCAAVANRSWPGGRYTDVPSLRWSREDTSTRSGTGAIRITPVSGIRPASASSAIASRYAHQSAAAGRTGICRYSSHSRWARVHVGCCRCASAIAARMTRFRSAVPGSRAGTASGCSSA